MLDLDLEASREAEEVMIIGRGKEKGLVVWRREWRGEAGPE